MSSIATYITPIRSQLRQKRCKVIFKNKGALIVGIFDSSCAFVAWAEVALRIMLGTLMWSGWLDFTLPRALRAMG